jgi:DNA-binding response OmpR family regulator
MVSVALAPKVGADGLMDQDGSNRAVRILVVEDHRDSRDAMAKLLRYSGYGVSTASCVAEALRAAELDSIDLIICDLTLPDGDGSDLVRELCQRHHVPAIAVTGHTADSESAQPAHSGFCERLTKPVQLPILLAAIENATRHNRPPPEQRV